MVEGYEQDALVVSELLWLRQLLDGGYAVVVVVEVVEGVKLVYGVNVLYIPIVE